MSIRPSLIILHAVFVVVALVLTGCELSSLSGMNRMVRGKSCIGFKIEHGVMPTTNWNHRAKGKCDDGYEWDGPEVECNWVDRLCKKGTNGKLCAEEYRFGEPGTGLTDWPKCGLPTEVENLPVHELEFSIAGRTAQALKSLSLEHGIANSKDVKKAKERENDDNDKDVEAAREEDEKTHKNGSREEKQKSTAEDSAHAREEAIRKAVRKAGGRKYDEDDAVEAAREADETTNTNTSREEEPRSKAEDPKRARVEAIRKAVRKAGGRIDDLDDAVEAVREEDETANKTRSREENLKSDGEDSEHAQTKADQKESGRKDDEDDAVQAAREEDEKANKNGSIEEKQRSKVEDPKHDREEEIRKAVRKAGGRKDDEDDAVEAAREEDEKANKNGSIEEKQRSKVEDPKHDREEEIRKAVRKAGGRKDDEDDAVEAAREEDEGKDDEDDAVQALREEDEKANKNNSREEKQKSKADDPKYAREDEILKAGKKTGGSKDDEDNTVKTVKESNDGNVTESENRSSNRDRSEEMPTKKLSHTQGEAKSEAEARNTRQSSHGSDGTVRNNGKEADVNKIRATRGAEIQRAQMPPMKAMMAEPTSNAFDAAKVRAEVEGDWDLHVSSSATAEPDRVDLNSEGNVSLDAVAKVQSGSENESSTMASNRRLRYDHKKCAHEEKPKLPQHYENDFFHSFCKRRPNSSHDGKEDVKKDLQKKYQETISKVISPRTMPYVFGLACVTGLIAFVSVTSMSMRFRRYSMYRTIPHSLEAFERPLE
eukprot:TRINITY_DN5202_c0_g1_i2.p1 TRINITY_DN5202_c0_g1~~TRINITY_DN5202_c0_g1_i2.p1  ORF type:complete len:769 (+),score=129.73 TRINITY_DN5202_c0_g1_i2:75-2381(+)